MDETKKIPFKNGATFQFTFAIRGQKNAIQNFSGITISSSVKTADGAIWPLDIVVLDDNRSFRVTYAGSTKGWPQGDASMDIKFVRQSDGLIQYSNTLEYKVYKSIT